MAVMASSRLLYCGSSPAKAREIHMNNWDIRSGVKVGSRMTESSELGDGSAYRCIGVRLDLGDGDDGGGWSCQYEEGIDGVHCVDCVDWVRNA